GKYNFAEWTGYTSSTSNPLTIEFKGASEFVSIQAVYVEDYTMVIVWVTAIVIIVAVAAFIIYRIYRGRKFSEEAEATEESLEEEI
ncbi:MAG: hypothetical protein QXZ59_04210, partial [Nitrososphaeria archaeon]